MNYSDRYLRDIATYSAIDVMLADVAVRIQLSPTDYQLAVDHYHAIHEWIEREGSPLFGLVLDFYTQGGFTIGATVARHATDDEFDIDVMVQLAYRSDVDPEFALSILNEAIRAETGSRYHRKVERKTRCSTVYYDGMHLDVTPTVRLVGTVEKTGVIFHSKPDDPKEPKLSLKANPHGFARWFIEQTPPDENFGAFFEKRSLDYDRSHHLVARADAAAVPVPAQCPAYRKSRAVIALQLIKRWRNLAYAKHHKGRRLPPSVLLAYFVAKNANNTHSLSDELCYQVERLLTVLREAQNRREIIAVVNPTCPDDILTDRWPASLQDQEIFIEELDVFAVKLQWLLREISLSETQAVLEELFGEAPAKAVVKDYVDRAATDVKRTGGPYLPGKASIPAALVGTSSATTNVRTAPSHTFFGNRVDDLAKRR